MGNAAIVSLRDATRNTTWAFVLLAVGGGVVGGFTPSALRQPAPAQSESPATRVIRATAVELVDGAGNRVGFLGTDEKHNTSLSFFDAKGKKRAELSLDRGTS